MWVSCCHQNRLFLSQQDVYLILKKIVQILDMQYLAYIANFRQNSCVAFSVT